MPAAELSHSLEESRLQRDSPASGPGAVSSLNIYNVSGTIFFHSNQSILNGYGT